MDSGYSGGPLAQKLGFKSGFTVALIDAPDTYMTLVAPLPDGIVFCPVDEGGIDVIHLFVTSQSTLETQLPLLKTKIVPNGMIWVSWYKKAAQRPTDVTEDTIRNLALTIGLVDVKVCAINTLWSGLKLVIPVKDR